MKYLKSLLLFLGLFLLLNIFVTILSFFDVFNEKSINVLKLLTLIITLIVTGINIGMKSKKKAYLEGLKLSGIIILLLTVINVILPIIDFSLSTFLYYLLIIFLITISSSIGINFKKEK